MLAYSAGLSLCAHLYPMLIMTESLKILAEPDQLEELTLNCPFSVSHSNSIEPNLIFSPRQILRIN